MRVRGQGLGSGLELGLGLPEEHSPPPGIFVLICGVIAAALGTGLCRSVMTHPLTIFYMDLCVFRGYPDG